MRARVEAKLARMRKPQSFIVMPMDDGRIMVQSDKSIGVFDYSGHGVLNTKGCYFPHLTKFMGAVEFDFPPEFVRECLAVCPALDSIEDIGGVIVENTVRVVS